MCVRYNHLIDVNMFISLSSLCISMMIANIHVCGIMLLISDMVYMLVRYAPPCGPICLRCLMLW